jgi:elongation factor Tu
VLVTSDRRRYLLFDGSTYREGGLGLFGEHHPVGIGLVVVSAPEGVGPETREQIRLLRLVGVEHVVGFVNRDDGYLEEADRAEFELRLALAEDGYCADELPMIRGDALAAQKETRSSRFLGELLKALDACPATAIAALEERPFLMPIENTFGIHGRGTVVTGQILRGIVRVGDRVDVTGLRADLRNVEVAGVEMISVIESARPGDNVGLLIREPEDRGLERGQVLAAPGSIRAASRFDAVIRLHPPEEGGRRIPAEPGYRPQVHIYGYDGSGRLTPREAVTEMKPGGIYLVTVELMPDRPLALEPGFGFWLREGERSIGVGMVTNVP